MSPEEEEEQNNKWIQSKMRKTRKKPFTIEKTRGVYDMSSPVRGWCLIFSNHVFSDPNLGKLLGYERDKENFEKVFSELGFVTKVFEKVTAEEIKQIIQEHANRSASDCLYPTNALAVVILTHGNTNYLCGFNYKSNNNPDQPNDKIGVTELMDIFSNQNCPHLVGKPKIVFLQACRGAKFDFGLDAPSAIIGDNKVATPIACTLRSGKRLYNEMDETIAKLPSVGEEIMIFYATPSNYASYVPLTGSLFGVQLCVELKKWAWKRDLNDIMLSVNNALRRKEIATMDKKSAKQVLEIYLRSPTRKLYFNPGYYKHNTLPSTSTSTLTEPSTSIVNVESNNVINVQDEGNGSSNKENIGATNGENGEPSRKQRKKSGVFKLVKGQTFIDGYFRKTKQ